MVCYAVIRFGDEWGVLSERRRIGRFSAEDAALQLGVMLAFEALAAGHEVELLRQDMGGQLSPYGLPGQARAPVTRSPVTRSNVAVASGRPVAGELA